MKKLSLRTMAMALALCLIAAVMPMPAANAAGETPIYPVDIDFSVGTTENNITEDSNAPTFDANGYEIDFDVTTADNTPGWFKSNSEGINVRFEKTTGKASFRIKAAPGTYNVFVKLYGRHPDNAKEATVYFNGTNIGTVNSYAVVEDKTDEVIKMEKTVTITEADYHTVLFQNATAVRGNFYLAGVALVPVGTVNTVFSSSDLATSLFYINGNTISIPACALSYAKHGCEFNIAESTASKVQQHKGTHLFSRVGAVYEKVAFNVWVPEDGTYSVKYENNSTHASGGVFDLYVGGENAGSINMQEKVGVYELGNVKLYAGENTVIFMCTSLPAGVTQSYNYLKGIQLIPMAAAEIAEDEVFGDTSAYVTKNEEGKLMLTTFSAIDSTNYSKVGFIINEGEADEIITEEMNVYSTIAFQSTTKGNMTITPDMFFKRIAKPATAQIFFSTEEVTADTTITVCPYAVSLDGQTTIIGQTYEIAL